MIRSISIDDEPLAHKVVRNYCDRLDFIELEASFSSAIEALGYLTGQQVDLIFLDINMPVLKGLDFLRTLPAPPAVIITSAHQEYALDSFELDVADYLLKPFGFDRFLKAVNKVASQLKLEADARQAPRPTPERLEREPPQSLFVKGEKKTHQIHLSNVRYLEGAGAYVKIYLEGKMVMTLERLGHFEESLPDHFVRVHKSFIVALNKVETIEGNRLFTGGQEIPIGQVYKQNLKRWLKS